MCLNDANSIVKIAISGHDTELLFNEAGGHRIQRIPRTERNGRVHSSTVTVAVMGDIVRKTVFDQREPNDFTIEWYSGSGAGGQHRNKHQNSARVTHIPTGLVRQAQTRSRENSLQAAMQALHTALDEQSGHAAGESTNAVRKAHVGSGMRSDKRRTLRFQEGRVHDHISGKSAPIDRVMKGEFRLLW